MSKSMGIVWEAPPHTIAKIDMLSKYLFVWFSMLGSHFRGADLWYVDGFSGPGEYKNEPTGSPIAAIKAAKAALEQSKNWCAGSVRFLFIEENKARFDNLSRILSGITLPQRLSVSLRNEAFSEGIHWLRVAPESGYRPGSPIFSFVDPFGTRGLDFEAISGLLSMPSSEVLINFDSDGAARVLKGGEDANHNSNLTRLFGGPHWKSVLDPSSDLSSLSRQAVDLYVHRLRSLPRVRFAFKFTMSSKRGLANYHLVFASQHPKGLEKMKEVMKQFDQSGEYTFCDAHVGQESLFTFDDVSGQSRRMLDYFKGKTISLSEADRYALNESPFVNSKAMLAALEKQGLLTVNCSTGKRRPWTFPADKVLSVTFLEPVI